MVEQYNSSKDKITKLFDDRSSTFDKSTGRAMKMLTRILLREINILKNPVCLDIGSGTGISTFELSRKIQNKGTIIGIDISPSMIEVAKRNASQQGFKDIEFRVGDAEQLDFTDSMFDLVICNMTLHYIPDKMRSLREMHRVLKPGGQVALHFNGGPCFQEIISVGSAVASRHPEYPMFQDAIHEFRDSFLGFDDAITLIESAGFGDHRTFGRQVRVFVDPENVLNVGESWDLWKSGLPLDVRDAFRVELVDAFTADSEERGFKFTYFTVVSVGIKSE